ncbi:uncharacterized protein LOC143428609 [Xylocopa sonorina]|uniref:uncharacterized protein LOC143428609 n=1 Tax=Xylocopa sonorina TaxID=1818115 RepID=UPI00403AD36F
MSKKMLQLPVIVVLVVSLSVGRASPPLSDKDGHETDKVSTQVDVKNATDAVNNSSIQVDTPLTKEADDKKVNGSEGGVVTGSTKISPDVTPPIIPADIQKSVENNKQNCTSTKEQDDMLECNVTPKDEDPAIEQNVTLSGTESTTIPTPIANKTVGDAESQVPEVTSNDKESVEKEKVEVIKDTKKTTDQVPYEVVSTETDHILNINHSVTLNTDTNATNAANEVSTVSSLLVGKIVASTGTEEVVKPVKSVSQIKNKRMSPGIIALVTAITFAIAIASVYIGMIVWRRYSEYRYGHRELLVNELEFDTNDLRHFEL